MSDDQHKHEHHILSNATSMWVFIYLLIFTIITVGVSRLDFGSFNFAIAMFIAALKAGAVVLFFMGLKYDSNDNRAIFGTSFIFVLIFLVLTGTDLFSRGNVKVVGSPLMEVTGGKQFEDPWIPTEELLAHGKAVYKTQACGTCHGDEGFGNGPAGVALNPKPRNFHEAEGWKNGRNPAEVFGTLTKGLGLMPAYANISASDRWAVAHYILSWGPEAPEAKAEDLAKIGIDPNADEAAVEPRKIPVDFALDRYLQEI